MRILPAPLRLALLAVALVGSAHAETVPAVEGTVLGEASMGAEDAPVTLIEYASITCGICRAAHRDVFPMLEERIAAGEVRFILRELPTYPNEIAIGGFSVARCAGADQYFNVITDFFENQDALLKAAREGTAGTILRETGEKYGLDSQEFKACTRDDSVYNAITANAESAGEYGVTGTPTFILNGEKLGNDARKLEVLTKAIDDALGK